MRILLLGRKHIAKCEDMLVALKNIGVEADAILFPNFHYAEGGYSVFLASGDSSELAVPPLRSRAQYYAYHFFRLSILLLKRFRKNRYDVLFAVDWFEGLLLLLFRRLFACESRVIFYSYDYYFFSKRFSSRFLINKIDAWVARHADEVWVVNDAIRLEREKRGVFSKIVKTVPLGITDKRCRYFPKDTRNFLFVGNLKSGHNLSKLLDVFGTIAKSDYRFHLTLIGKGNLEGELREKIALASIGSNISMRGFVRESEIVSEISSGAYAAGIALYEDTPEVRAVDPGKIKDYLSWGLPVITTPFNPISKEISSRDIGYVVLRDDVESLMKFFLGIRLDDLEKKRNGIGAFIGEHSFENLFRKNLSSVSRISIPL